MEEQTINLPQNTPPPLQVPDAASETTAVKKKSPIKLLIKLAIALIVLALLGGIGVFVVSMISNNQPQQQKQEEEKKDESVIPNKKITSYRLMNPTVEPITSFIYFGEATSLFSPHTAYFLDKNYKLVGLPYFISAESLLGKSWCQGAGKSSFNISQGQTAAYCLENISGKEIILRKLDLNSREYKEYLFEGTSDLFNESPTARVISSKDGDTALIYSLAGALVFDSVSGNLFKTDLPLTLDIQKTVHISNNELAVITTTNKIYRINLSNRKGGIFDVNFIGITPEQLIKGLKTSRLSKDGRRIIFTISDLVETLPADKNVNYQTIVAYNIDLGTAKVSDELAYDEKFLVSCRYLVGDKFCVYRADEENEARKDIEVLYIKDFEGALKPIINALKPDDKGYRMKIELIGRNPNYFFIKSPALFVDRDVNNFTWMSYVYNTQNSTLNPISY